MNDWGMIVIDAYGIHIGPLYLRFYALILVTAIFVGTWITARRAKAHDALPGGQVARLTSSSICIQAEGVY